MNSSSSRAPAVYSDMVAVVVADPQACRSIFRFRKQSLPPACICTTIPCTTQQYHTYSYVPRGWNGAAGASCAPCTAPACPSAVPPRTLGCHSPRRSPGTGQTPAEGRIFMGFSTLCLISLNPYYRLNCTIFFWEKNYLELEWNHFRGSNKDKGGSMNSELNLTRFHFPFQFHFLLFIIHYQGIHFAFTFVILTGRFRRRFG